MAIFVSMSKAELFAITTAKAEQRKAEMLLTPAERISLCLDLMDLNASLVREQKILLLIKIKFRIELSFQHE